MGRIASRSQRARRGAVPPGEQAKPKQRGHRGAGRPLPVGPATARRGETRCDRPVSRSVVRALCGHGPAAQHRIAPRSSACCCRHHRRRILCAAKYRYSCRCRHRRLAPRRPQHPPLPAPLLPAPPRRPSPGSAAGNSGHAGRSLSPPWRGGRGEWSRSVRAPWGAGPAGHGSPEGGGRAAVAPGGGCPALPCPAVQMWRDEAVVVPRVEGARQRLRCLAQPSLVPCPPLEPGQRRAASLTSRACLVHTSVLCSWKTSRQKPSQQ